MTRTTKHPGGYVLLELMVTVGLLALAVSSILDFRIRADQDQAWASSYSNDLAELRRALDAIETDVRHASRVLVRRDRFELSTIDGDITFSHAAGTLVRRDGDGRERVLARCIADVAVETDGVMARVGLTVQRRRSTAGGGPTLWTCVMLRNREVR